LCWNCFKKYSSGGREYLINGYASTATTVLLLYGKISVTTMER
jgi:hypothetical protein